MHFKYTKLRFRRKGNTIGKSHYYSKSKRAYNEACNISKAV
nr:MAG TPA: hypothetical protein [Bacteriophage sp.]